MADAEKQEALHVEDAEDGGAIVHLPEGEEPIGEDDDSGGPAGQAGDNDSDDDPNDDNRDGLRESRRNRRRARKEHHRAVQAEKDQRLALLQRQNEELLSRLQSVEHRTHQAELGRVDSAAAEQIQRMEFAAQKRAEAVRNGDDQLFAQADAMYQEARETAQHLKNLRERAANQPPVSSGPDPIVKSLAAQWVSKNQWYKPNSSDADSAVAFSIDKAMHKEGWNPSTQEYWEELDSRLQKYLPHRYNADMNDEPQDRRHRTVVTGSGRESVSQNSGGRASFTLSKERVQAMKDAGMWDNQETRQRMIQRYINEDRQNNRNRG